MSAAAALLVAAAAQVAEVNVICTAPYTGCQAVPGPRVVGAWAWASYDDGAVDATGWGALAVVTHELTGGALTPGGVMYAAGYAEGVLTQHRIWQFYNNYASAVFNGSAGAPVFQLVKGFLETNHDYARSIAPRGGPDGTGTYLDQVAWVYDQVRVPCAVGQWVFLANDAAVRGYTGRRHAGGVPVCGPGL